MGSDEYQNCDQHHYSSVYYETALPYEYSIGNVWSCFKNFTMCKLFSDFTAHIEYRCF